MSNKKKYVCAFLLVIYLLAMVTLVWLNIKNNYLDFFQANFIDLINLILTTVSIVVVIWLTYYLTQLRTDERQKKEAAERVINRLFLLLEETTLYTINDEEDRKLVSIKHRSITNKLQILKNYNLFEAEKISYMETALKTYWGIISDNFADFDYLKLPQTVAELQKSIVNIQDKLEECISDLYKK